MNNLAGKTIGFIGGGQMAEAIFSGLIMSGAVQPGDICVADVSPDRLGELTQHYGIRVIGNDPNGNFGAIEMVKSSEIVVLAVKPQVAHAVMEAVAPYFAPNQLLLSIVGGLPLVQLEAFFRVPVIRVMPNTPMAVREGVAALSPGSLCAEAHVNVAMELFSILGKAFLVAEHMINSVTGLSGCGPAYAYMFMEALADGAVLSGLPRDLAYQLAAQTLLGSAKMMLQTGEHPGKLKDSVCSPGGGTIAGVQALENGSFRGTVIQAVEAGVQRMEEISRNG